MFDIVNILSNRSRWKLLRVLVFRQQALPLRQLAELSGVSLTATQHAVDEMEREGLVGSSIDGKYRLISLKIGDPIHSLLKQLFKVIDEHDTSINKVSQNQKARKVLEFNNEALEMIRSARK
ncbi:MAG: hypothetical protein EA369_08100 [Bradymonadales bacterium]|nr:MAG: hypothetical protein EA369_08100 [Bradymonadales bacterium]